LESNWAFIHGSIPASSGVEKFEVLPIKQCLFALKN
jgi:hypothetical protein